MAPLFHPTFTFFEPPAESIQEDDPMDVDPVELASPQPVLGLPELPAFEALKVNLKACMVYLNIHFFDLQQLFRALTVHEIPPDEIPYNKKRRTPNVKKVRAPPGAIFHTKYQREQRGLPITKRRPDVVPDTMVRMTAQPAQQTMMYFRNAIELYLATSFHNVHVMIFGSSLKVTGCVTDEQKDETLRLLWTELARHRGLFYTIDLATGEGAAAGTPVDFLVDDTMNNMKLNLGFLLSRQALNNVMNDPRYADMVVLSSFENTSQSAVRIELRQTVPDDMQYTVLRWTPLGEGDVGVFSTFGISHQQYTKCKTMVAKYEERFAVQGSKKKRLIKPIKSIKLMCFRSSTVMMSYRFEAAAAKAYEFFAAVIRERFAEIVENATEKDAGVVDVERFVI